ncbi:MAG: response regulator [Planctomycetia bacterium]|nr:response regulator [Planctomycetia bacterium]
MENNETQTRVLIIDDDPEISESIRLALETTGYEVQTARDGSIGLAIAERTNPDLIILDMMMPKRSGFLVLETLRQTQKTPSRIIMITANEGTRHLEYAQELGVDEYIRKPFPMEVLLGAVVRVLGK